MKFTNLILCCLFLISSCAKKDVIGNFPPYKLIIEFAKKIKPETDLVLSGYGINNGLPKDYQKKGIGSFRASFKLPKEKNDEISLEYARNLIVFLGERFLEEINSNSEIRPDLDFYPFTSDSIDITVHFKDENQIDLGQGVALIYFYHGKIVYEGYKIEKYTNRFPAIGKHFTIHEESYAEALEIVKRQRGV
jgi:hypothetical protein